LPNDAPLAAIFGCAGTRLTPAERDFFADANPLGFCLFRRNCQEPAQVRDLVAALREAVGRADAPVLIDQEGGRVARLRPPHWRDYPSAARLAALPDPEALEALGLGARLIADDLVRLGIDVDCAPVLDLPSAGADPVIGDRAFGSEPGRVARLARAFCKGLLAGGVLPVIKHMPGHGRAQVDSHLASPHVEAGRAALAAHDFAPFRALREMPWAMTAHIVYTAIDPERPATLSRRVIGDVVRGEIGYDGVLVSDDLSMGALGGGLGDRARLALAAGCDLVLHCNGDRREMEEVVAAARPLSKASRARLARADAWRAAPIDEFDRIAAEARFDALLAGSH
jgi:beta-N-acetylhexosaminidase